MNALLFLGSGYVGNYFRILYPYSIHSYRAKEEILRHGGGVIFDSNIPETWQNIKKSKPDGIIISFPLNESTHADDLWNMLSGLSSRIIIIGTTAGFKIGLEEITDNSPIDKSNPRTMAEESFRKKGASIVHSAGIYGTGRNPLDWIRKGLIKNSATVVNLVHAEDLARSCNFIIENFVEGQRYVISDNHPYRWNEIIEFALRKKFIKNPGIISDKAAPSKIVRPVKLFDKGFSLRHPDLFEEIQKLEEA